MTVKQLKNINSYASVAQLDRVGGFEPLGREFESLRVHQTKKKGVNVLAFTPFLFVLYSEVRTPQFDKTHRVLDSRQAALKG